MEKPWGKLEDMGAVGGDMVIDADKLVSICEIMQKNLNIYLFCRFTASFGKTK